MREPEAATGNESTGSETAREASRLRPDQYWRKREYERTD